MKTSKTGEEEQGAGEGAEEVAEDLDGTKVLGGDFVDHAVEFLDIHGVHGLFDPAFDVELFDDERQAFRPDEVFQFVR